MLPRVWIDHDIKNRIGEYKFEAMQNHQDQILSEEMFADNEIKVTPLSVFREPAKYRIYSICEFSDDA